MNNINVYGAGLAGSEAAWQAAHHGAHVTLYEMKPRKKSPAHHSDTFAELVCSNSLRSAEFTNGAGLLKEELRRMDSLIMEAAYASRVSAGGALAVDRNIFSEYVTEKIRSCPNIEVVEEEMTDIPADEITVVATGPLTSDALAAKIAELIGGKSLYFYDAAAPIVDFESVDMTKAFFASRYDKGTPDYINCPFSREEYDAFWNALTTAEEAPVHGFEDSKVFEGCMPIEVNARRGYDTLRFGILKPIGLPDPKTGKDPYAVLQLRRDNANGTLYNLVGCQTHLKFGEQKRVFSMITALRNAEFVRYGVMHRNTFLDSPRLLDATYALKSEPRIRFAGQMTGVEGYIESTASGWVAGVATAMDVLGKPMPTLDRLTATGALATYISDHTVTKFQPMNINFGIIEPLGYKIKGKREKNAKISERALERIESLKGEL
mgnify:CR=1 FL=1